MTAPQQPGREQEIRARASAAEARREQYAAAIQRRVVPGYTLTSILPEVYEAADAAIAVADEEQAAAVRRALEGFASRLTARAASMGAEYFRVDQVADAARRIATEEHAVASPASERCLSFTSSEVAPGLCELCHEPKDQHTPVRGQCAPAMQVAPYPPSSSWHVQVRLVDTWAIARTGAQSLAAAREREASVVEQTGRETRILREDTAYALEARTELPAREQGEEAAR